MVLSTVHCLRTKEIEEVDLTSASHHWHSVSDYVLSLLHFFFFFFFFFLSFFFYFFFFFFFFFFLFFSFSFFLLSLSLSFLKDVTLWSTELSLQF